MSVGNLQNLVSYLSFGSIFLFVLFGFLMWIWHDRNYSMLRQPSTSLGGLLTMMALAVLAAIVAPIIYGEIDQTPGETLSDDQKLARLAWQVGFAGFFVCIIVFSFVYVAFNRKGVPVVKAA